MSLEKRVMADSVTEMLPGRYLTNQKHKSTACTYPAGWRAVRRVSGPHGRDVQLVATGPWNDFQVLCSVDLVFTCSTF